VAVQDLWMHRRAFDALADQIKQSVALAAQLPTGSDAPTSALFDLALERYADIFRRPTFAHLPLGHLIDTAIETEALLAYEAEAEARRLARLVKAPLAPLAPLAARHARRLDALLSGVLRGHGLASSSHRPYVMPSRGVFVAPATPALLAWIESEDNYYRPWNGGVVTLIEDRDLDTWRARAGRVAILFLDGEELLGEDLRHQSDPALAARAIEDDFARRLQYAEGVSKDGVGEDFAAYYARLLLKQNVLLRSVLPRLLAEGHHAAHRHFAPLLEEHNALLRAALAGEARPAEPSSPVRVLSALLALERNIDAQTAAWIEHGRSADSAGLLFQFEGMQRAFLSAHVKALHDAHS